jgi:hypothetical protein
MNGYLLPSSESKIGSRLSELEHQTHVLSPVAETTESFPGGFHSINLTYTKPKADYSTKPPPHTLEGTEQRAERKVKDSPSKSWNRLGPPAYHFVGDDRFLQKLN